MDKRVNVLPAPTWNWLKVNGAPLPWPETEKEPLCQSGLPEQNGQSPRHAETEQEAGKPYDCQELAQEAGKPHDPQSLEQEAGKLSDPQEPTQSRVLQEPQRLTFLYPEEGDCAGTYELTAEGGTHQTVVMVFSSEKEARGCDAMHTTVKVGNDSSITLVQIEIMGDECRFMNNIEAEVGEKGEFHLIQLMLSGGKTWQGCRTELSGTKARFTADLSYLLTGKRELDMNVVANHTGQRTVSEIQAYGVLRDESRKCFRGTIDFHKGCTGSVGNEMEEVLMMEDGVVNQTVPLILCDEEDVEGNHGATIGQLEDDLLFYLESRGLAREAIYEMMAQAKVDVVCRKIPDEKTRSLVQEFLL